MSALELKLPPVALFALLVAGTYGLARAFPAWTIAPPWNASATQRLAGGLAASGVAIALAGVVEFRRRRTTVNPHSPGNASAVVTGGIYRWTRNPMYLGILLVLAAWALYLGHAAAALALPAFVAYMNRFQIVPEERILTAKFGPDFARYLRSVRRWI